MEKAQILIKLGYVENPTRMIWLNLERRLAFSDAVIRNHDVAWLKEKAIEEISSYQFIFHSNRQIQLEVCRTILEELGLSGLTPVNRPTNF